MPFLVRQSQDCLNAGLAGQLQIVSGYAQTYVLPFKLDMFDYYSIYSWLCVFIDITAYPRR